MNALIMTLNQMLTLAFLAGVGVLLRRYCIKAENAPQIMSSLVTNIFLPCLVLSSFLSHFTLENLAINGQALLCGTIITGITVIISKPISSLFSRGGYERRCYRYSLVITNFGYIGYALTLGVLGYEMFCQFVVFCIPASVFLYSQGLVWLNPHQGRIQWKSLLTPPFLGMIVGMVMGVFKIRLPAFILAAIDSCGNCMSPLAMFVFGFILGDTPIGKLLKNVRVYILSLLRLVVIPVIVWLILSYLKVSQTIVILATAYSCMPFGLNTIIFPAAWGEDTTLGASLAIISSTGAVLTVPLLLSLAVNGI